MRLINRSIDRLYGCSDCADRVYETDIRGNNHYGCPYESCIYEDDLRPYNTYLEFVQANCSNTSTFFDLMED